MMNGVLGTISTGGVITFPTIQYYALLPEIAFLVAALLSIVISGTTRLKRESFPFTAIGVAASAFSAAWSFHLITLVHTQGPKSLIGGSMALDGFSTFLILLISVATGMSLLLGESFMFRVGHRGPEFSSLLLLSSAGAMFMVSANDLIVIFLGLEILSIALYVLVAFSITSSLSKEAAFKYFILGGFSSALFLYGIALTYGATGSTNIGQIAKFLSSNVLASNGVLLAGMALLLAGFGFKVAAVPFQLWTPDVYQGAPSTVTGFMAAVAKAAGFAGLLRVFLVAFPTLSLTWQPILEVIAVLTLLSGAVVAIVQSEVKRMMAYSSINHAGFILIGVFVGTSLSETYSLYYLFTYSITVVGTFGLISLISSLEGRPEISLRLEDLRGLSKRRPGIAVALSVMLVSQAGIPFTTGFLAKFSVISAAVSARHYPIAVIAMVSAVIAAFFYLRIVLSMFTSGARLEEHVEISEEVVEVAGDGGEMELVRESVIVEVEEVEEVEEEFAGRIPIPALVSIGISLVVTVGFGIVANPLLHLATRATLLR